MLATRSMGDYKRTQDAYRRREPGWYTVNRRTDIAVYGPAEQDECDRHRRRVNADWPTEPDDLIVVRVGADPDETYLTTREEQQ